MLVNQGQAGPELLGNKMAKLVGIGIEGHVIAMLEESGADIEQDFVQPKLVLLIQLLAQKEILLVER